MNKRAVATSDGLYHTGRQTAVTTLVNAKEQNHRYSHDEAAQLEESMLQDPSVNPQGASPTPQLYTMVTLTSSLTAVFDGGKAIVFVRMYMKMQY